MSDESVDTTDEAPQDAHQEEDASAGRRMTLAAIVVSGFLLVSKFAGLAKEMVLANRLGAGAATDAFKIIYNSFIFLVYTKIEKLERPCYLPLFVKRKEESGEEKAWAFGSVVMAIHFLLLVVIAVLAVAFAPAIIRTLWPNMQGDGLRLAILLMRMMAPALVAFSLSVMPELTLHAYKEFTIPALAEAAFRILVLVSLLVLVGIVWKPGDADGILAAGIGVVLGGVARLVVQLPKFRKYWRVPSLRTSFSQVWAEARALPWALLRSPHAPVLWIGALTLSVAFTIGIAKLDAPLLLRWLVYGAGLAVGTSALWWAAKDLLTLRPDGAGEASWARRALYPYLLGITYIAIAFGAYGLMSAGAAAFLDGDADRAGFWLKYGLGGAIAALVLFIGARALRAPEEVARAAESVDLARNTDMPRLWGLIPPIIVGLTFSTLRTYIDSYCGTEIGEGVYSCLDYARRLPDTMAQILPMAVSFVVYPFLSEWAHRGEKEKLGEALVQTSRVIAFIFIPATVWMIVLRWGVLWLVYGGGEFEPKKQALSILALLAYTPGMAFFSIEGILNKWYFALDDTKTPNYVGSACAILHVLIAVIGVFTLDLGDYSILAIALALTISKSTKVIILYALLRGRVGGIDWGRIATFAVKLGVSCGIMAAATYFTADFVEGRVELAGRGSAAVYLTVASGVAIPTFLIAAFLLRIEETRTVVEQAGKIFGKLKKRLPGGSD